MLRNTVLLTIPDDDTTSIATKKLRILVALAFIPFLLLFVLTVIRDSFRLINAQTTWIDVLPYISLYGVLLFTFIYLLRSTSHRDPSRLLKIVRAARSKWKISLGISLVVIALSLFLLLGVFSVQVPLNRWIAYGTLLVWWLFLVILALVWIPGKSPNVDTLPSTAVIFLLVLCSGLVISFAAPRAKTRFVQFIPPALVPMSPADIPLTTPTQQAQAGALALESFSSAGSEGGVRIDVTDSIYTVAVLSFEKQPPDLQPYLEETVENRSYDVDETDRHGVIEIQLQQKHISQPNLVVFLQCAEECDPAGYLEILRQSGSQLKERFDFDKPDGYNIVARTSPTLLPRDPLVFQSNASYVVPLTRPFPDLSAFYPEEGVPPEIAEAVAIMRFIWSEPLRIGPPNDNSPARLNPLDRLGMLREGKWSVLCAGIRDIFLDLAVASPRIPKARYIGLYQYWPVWPDLTTHSHAVAEIYSDTLEKWVMIDPDSGAIFRLGETYLSVAEIHEMSAEERQLIAVEQLVPGRSFPTRENMSYLEQGYFSYFGTVQYGPVEEGNP